MNISDAKRLEYTLSFFREYLTAKRRQDYPKYKIIWNYEGQLVTGDLLKWSTTPFPYLVRPKMTSDFEVYEERLSIDDEHKNVFPRNVREAWFDKFSNQWTSLDDLYSNPEVLLQESIKFVNSLNLDDIDQPQYQMLNVNYLYNKLHLKFVLLAPNCDLAPISLISSEN